MDGDGQKTEEGCQRTQGSGRSQRGFCGDVHASELMEREVPCKRYSSKTL